MEMFIKSINLENFMGFKSITYDFNSNKVVISGQNGCGKTTINTAHNWLWFDRDAALHSNPNVRMIGAEECTVSVTEDIEIDGKTIQVAKSQTMAVKGVKTSLSNTYSINGVPKTETAFRDYFIDLGVDFNLMFTLSCPNVFLSQKTAECRQALFGMASELTDKEIASRVDGCENIVELLDNYTIDEIKALQNQTLRKIKEVYGDKGEILNATITGLESAKTDTDTSSYEVQIKGLKTRLSSLESEKESIQVADTSDYTSDVAKIRDDIFKVSAKISDEEYLMGNKKRELDSMQTEITSLQERWKELKRSKFDDSKLSCPTCGTPYSKEKQTEIKAEFESNIKKETEKVEERGKSLSESKKKITVEIKGFEGSISAHKKNKVELEKKLKALDEMYSSVIEQNKTAQIRIQEINAEIKTVESQIHSLEIEVAKTDSNSRIDEQIQELRNKQIEYEQNRADAEKILEQLKMISMKKNELLVEDINKNFDIVKFILFVTQKNGDVKDACIVTLDGYRFGESTNTGREFLAKLDIIHGLQRFYKQNYPVFLDGAESLSDITESRIDMPYQLFELKVSESELTIENK